MKRWTHLSAPAAPPTLPPAGYRFWGATNLLVGLNDADEVASFTDQSANGFHLLGSPGVRPQYKTNIINGLPAMLFDGSNDNLARTVDMFPTGYQHTVFAVYRLQTPPTLPSNWFVFDTQTDGALSRRFSQTFVTGGQPIIGMGRDGGGGAGSVNISPTENVVFAGLYDGASSLVQLNGDTGRQTSYVGSTDTTASAGAFVLGSKADGSTGFFAGYIAEFLVYASALSPTNFALAVAYLRAKYAI